MEGAQNDCGGLSVGTTLGPYRLEAVLGEGGMGCVFRARRESDGETVALKVLKPGLATQEEYARRFAHEARATAEVHHPHLVALLEVASYDGRPCLAMQYLTGRSLEDRLHAGPLGLAEAVTVCRQVAAGLDTLHAAGLVHRDIKSANVVVDEGGSATLTDFGLARGEGYSWLTQPGQVMGTIDYMAPELIMGERATPRSDVYSLGCVVWECLAGRRPFAGAEMTALAMAILSEPPQDPCAGRTDASVEFSLRVREALAKDPARRPASAGAYAERLAEALPVAHGG
ncbi:MAG: serine/threonine protein kinase [Actinobacteria bacterium]|nr:MAG: serine/threonine protein kinase [Actinomycetota bacterium]